MDPVALFLKDDEGVVFEILTEASPLGSDSIGQTAVAVESALQNQNWYRWKEVEVL